MCDVWFIISYDEEQEAPWEFGLPDNILTILKITPLNLKLFYICQQFITWKTTAQGLSSTVVCLRAC